MEFLNGLFTQVKDIFSKLSTTKKIIIGSVAGVLLISFVVLFSVSSQPPSVVLFADLSSSDFGQVTKKMDELGFKYTTTGTTSVFVDSKDREAIMTRLAQEEMIPKGIPGWKLFDMTKWTETDRELDVKYRRALEDEVKLHIEALSPIEKADVQIAMSEENLFDTQNAEFTSAVTVHFAPGYDKLSKKEIKGIVYLVSRAVGPKLKPENVTVTDATGKIISDFDDTLDKGKEELSIIDERRKIEEKERIKLWKAIENSLGAVFTKDRIQVVNLKVDFNWDEISAEEEEYSPIVMTPDNPETPYSEREVKDSLVVSEKTVDEKFQGHGWNPEGPAGTESNSPPGYKASDDQFAKYEKNENIKNHALNKTQRKIKREPYRVSKISVAVAIDGIQDLPRNPDGTYNLDASIKPIQISLTPEQINESKCNSKYNAIRKAYSEFTGKPYVIPPVYKQNTYVPITNKSTNYENYIN